MLHTAASRALSAALLIGSLCTAASAATTDVDFNGASLPSGWSTTGTFVNLSGDGYVLIDQVFGPPDTLTYSFNLATTSDVSFTFWYAAYSTSASSVFSATLSGQTGVEYGRTNAGGNAIQQGLQGAAFLAVNPGAGTLSGLDTQAAAQSFTGLAAGNYTVTFAAYNGALRAAKIDDFSLTTTAAPVPEPETYAMMLAGLGAIGFMARRRKAR